MLLGRSAEQEVVARLLASARLGRGGVLALVGEPGVGKTALLNDAVPRVDREARVLWATGTELEQDLPFAALHALLRPVLHLLDELPGPQADALGVALSLRRGRSGDRFATGAATLSLLSRAAEDAPVIVVLDDVQWVDSPSVEALAFAARRVREDPIAILVAGRSGEVPEALPWVPVLEVGGLDPAASAALARQVHPEANPLELAQLHLATGGNPLALLELRADAGLEGVTVAGPDSAPGPGLLPSLPDRLRTAFAARLDPLSESERVVALVAVVAGGDLRLTRAVGQQLDLPVDDLGGVVASGVATVVHGRLEFRHPLLRSVIYRAAPEELRRRVHLAAADHLMSDQDRDLRVWHRAAGALALDEGLAADLEAVGERAAARTALTVASTALERAARWSPDAEESRRRLVAAAQAAWDGGLGERALALLDEADPLEAGAHEPFNHGAPEPFNHGAHEPFNRGAAASFDHGAAELRARIAVRSGSIRSGLTLLGRAADAATGDERVLLLAEAVHAAIFLGDSVALAQLVSQLGESLPHAGSAAHAIGLAAAGAARVLLGQDGAPQLREAVPLLAEHVDPLTRPAALPWLAMAPLFLRDAQQGAQLRQLVDGVRASVGVGALPNLLFHVARDQATSGAWDRAGANYDEGVRLAGETGQVTDLAVCLAGLAALESRQGRAQACRAHADEALRHCSERDIRFGEIWCRLALADLALSEGRAGEAVEAHQALTQRLEQLGVRDPDLHPGPDLVEALLRTGEIDEAARVARGFVELARSVDRPWSLARAERALGMIAPDEEFDEHFVAAGVHHAQTRDDFETARTQLAHGRRLRRAGRRVDARGALREALTTFDSLGALLWADHTRTELEATGEQVPPRAPLGPDSLTPQELQVCLLLADGSSTREAAAALFLSPKTVEYHLRKAYTKLGIHSRAELTATLDSAPR